MKREIPIEDLQRLYTSNDMVKTDCRGCVGCSDCCHGMGESVVLDPMDCFWLENATGLKFTELLQEAIELNVSDGLILPNITMRGETETCHFLDQKGRCTVHAHRPGICRLFPLGRFYENGQFHYILQSHECPMEHKSKIKISKWLGISDLKKYEAYVCKWHYMLEDISVYLEQSNDQQLQKDLNSYLLEQFYILAFDSETDFYQQFDERFEKLRKLLSILKR